MEFAENGVVWNHKGQWYKEEEGLVELGESRGEGDYCTIGVASIVLVEKWLVWLDDSLIVKSMKYGYFCRGVANVLSPCWILIDVYRILP